MNSTQAGVTEPPGSSVTTTGRLDGRTLIRNLLARREAGLIIALILAAVLFAWTAPNFMTGDNIINILRQASFIGIIALGMTLVIVAAEIDISVGALVALTSAMMGILSRDAGWGLTLIIVAVLVMGAVSGLLVGTLRAFLGIPSIISTLALFLALRGLADFLTDASPIPIESSVLSNVFNGDVLGIPFPVVVFVILIALLWLVAGRTSFGRQIYAVGGNAVASRVAGVPVARVRIAIFIITGVLAAVTGIMQTARIGSGSSSIGQGLEFEVIAAVIIGGTTLTGGRGTILGTVVGVLFITELSNALVLYGVNSYAQSIVQGAVVLFAVILSAFQSGSFRSRD